MASFTGSVASSKDFSTAQWQRTNESTFIRTKSRGDTTTTVEYVVESLIGHGGYGKVYKLTPDDPTKKCKAIKICIVCQNYPGSSVLSCALANENKILERLPLSDGLPKPPKAFFPIDAKTKFPASLILHFYDFDFSRNFHSQLTEIELLDAFRQLAVGVDRLHSLGIYHKDLRLDNFMYDLQKKKAVLIDPYPTILWGSPETCVRLDVNSMINAFKSILFPKLDDRLTKAYSNCPEKVREILDSSSDTSTIVSMLEEFYKTCRLAGSSSLLSLTQQKKFDLEVQFAIIDVLKETEATGLLKAIDKVIAAYNAKNKTVTFSFDLQNIVSKIFLT